MAGGVGEMWLAGDEEAITVSDYTQGPGNNDPGHGPGPETPQGWPEQHPYPQESQQHYPAGGDPRGSGGPAKRPGTVLSACVLTWVFSAIGLVVGAGLALVFALAPEADLAEELRDNADLRENLDTLNMSVDEFVDAMVIVGVVLAALSLLAIIFAVMAFARSNVGRILLTVLGVITAVLTLVTLLIPATAAIVLAIVLLYVGGANGWYARREALGH